MPKWRPFTWVILGINVLFLVWIIAGVASTSGNATNCGSLSQQECNSAQASGAAIGVGIIIFLWALVDVILGVLWLVTRPKRRPCPVCGSDVKPGVVICSKCGYDFRSGLPAAAPSIPPPPAPTM